MGIYYGGLKKKKKQFVIDIQRNINSVLDLKNISQTQVYTTLKEACFVCIYYHTVLLNSGF